jgi:hypothetical protein
VPAYTWPEVWVTREGGVVGKKKERGGIMVVLGRIGIGLRCIVLR